MFANNKRPKMTSDTAEDIPMQSEAPEVDSTVMAPSGSASVSIALHPLVIMNVSEHYTRTKAQGEIRDAKVVGALLGKQEGRNIEILNSFELQYDLIEKDIVINMEYYRAKEEQFRQVFKELDFIGWYTNGGPPNPGDVHIHKQMSQINESSLLFKLNPLSKSSDLPVNIFESVIDLVDKEPRVLFIDVPYTLATEEAERIGVDHVARVSSAGNSEISSAAEHLQTQHNAIKMLHNRIKTILQYVKAVKAGEIPLNNEIMRMCRSLCQRLPVLESSQFQEDFFDQCNDVMLLTYLVTINKGCNTASDFITKFNLAYDRHGIGRRMRGLLY
ncbi:COP9 signalosome complex subunit 6-like [Rhopilema esculentum]|uniref:COP9 signalosome complex subunit 6-like n=1 Tax=Rhopilema esculentum TaxID=499914 RepID=UPI0031D3C84D